MQFCLNSAKASDFEWNGYHSAGNWGGWSSRCSTLASHLYGGHPEDWPKDYFDSIGLGGLEPVTVNFRANGGVRYGNDGGSPSGANRRADPYILGTMGPAPGPNYWPRFQATDEANYDRFNIKLQAFPIIVSNNTDLPVYMEVKPVDASAFPSGVSFDFKASWGGSQQALGMNTLQNTQQIPPAGYWAMKPTEPKELHHTTGWVVLKIDVTQLPIPGDGPYQSVSCTTPLCSYVNPATGSGFYDLKLNLIVSEIQGCKDASCALATIDFTYRIKFEGMTVH